MKFVSLTASNIRNQIKVINIVRFGADCSVVLAYIHYVERHLSVQFHMQIISAGPVIGQTS